MKPIRFCPPNFRCKVSHRDDDDVSPKWRLCFAENELAVRKLLEGKGYIVHEIQPYNFEEGWLKKARDEAKKAKTAVEAGETWEFKPLWSELKDPLLDLFNDHCAYCEADFAHVAFGDVEHYRPKGAVSEPDAVGHKGYYWLAYQPDNYLPSCQLCNQKAKKNHFPISKNSYRAYTPQDDLADEEPLLVNPYRDDYLEHLSFVPSKAAENPGFAVGKTEKGKESITGLRLNRPELVDSRRWEQSSIRNAVMIAITQENGTVLHNLIHSIITGNRQFSTATTYEINDFFEFFKNIGLKNPLDGIVNC